MTDDTGDHRPEDDEDDDVQRVRPDDSSESVTIIGPADEAPLRFDTLDEAPLRFAPDDTCPLPHWTEPPTGGDSRSRSAAGATESFLKP